MPLLVLVWRAVTSPGFWAALATPLVLQALWVTAVSTALTLVVVMALGTPLAYLLARRRFRGKWLVDVAIDLPLVLPPVVAGVALLMAFGRRGLFGPPLSVLGIELPFTLAAVVLAQIFVASPFYVRSARVGFAGIEPAGRGGGGDRRRLALADLPLGDAAAGAAGRRRRGGAVLRAGAVGVRGDAAVRRQLHGHDPDDVAGDHAGDGEPTWRRRWRCRVLLVILSGLVLLGARLLAHARLGD